MNKMLFILAIMATILLPLSIYAYGPSNANIVSPASPAYSINASPAPTLARIDIEAHFHQRHYAPPRHRDALEFYIHELRQSPLDDARKDAAKELGEFRAAPANDALIDALIHDDADNVRKEAAKSLGKLEFRESIDPLGEAMHHDPSKGVRKAAKKSLEHIYKHHHVHYDD